LSEHKTLSVSWSHYPFHEQRSLSERLYREQGLDTQKLLGHKSRKMTDRYNDDRGKDWIIVDIKTA
ncbi:hypothetical protein DXB20_14315, partial [Escherichia coli]